MLTFSQNTIKSTEFVVYVCDKLLPLSTWNMIAATAGQDQVQLRLLKVFAEMCAYCDVLENATQRIDNIYQVLRVILYLVNEFCKILYNTLCLIIGIYATASIER